MGCYTYPADKIDNLESTIEILKKSIVILEDSLIEANKQIDILIDLGQEYYGKEMRARD